MRGTMNKYSLLFYQIEHTFWINILYWYTSKILHTYMLKIYIVWTSKLSQSISLLNHVNVSNDLSLVYVKVKSLMFTSLCKTCTAIPKTSFGINVHAWPILHIMHFYFCIMFFCKPKKLGHRKNSSRYVLCFQIYKT